ncbi:MAG: response regulator [Muribaculaceae bacterium]|nr:response regulator [Muribaculaceae bacterium]
MGKTLILGNNKESYWINQLPSVPIREVPEFSINKSLDISNFLLSLPKDVDCLIIDAESLNNANPELPLDLILQIRLMLHDCRHSALANIILVSNFGVDAFRGYGPKSMVLMTENISIITPDEVGMALENSTPMTPAEYVEGFVKLIKIAPNEKIEGRHSIANEWGANVLANVISGEIKAETISVKASSSLYFKYSSIASLDASDVKDIVEGYNRESITSKLKISENVNALLIDDEAAKGWATVLSDMMPNAAFDVWDKRVEKFEDISEEYKQNIKQGIYDLIFLDLRMNGVEEEGIKNPQNFSGMQILKAIKNINEGIQVIMLTATNKAWNVSALLEAGANGYYMKESPEYHFSFNYSKQNALSLKTTIERCLENAYLQDIISSIKALELPSGSGLTEDIENQLNIAKSLILKANSNSDIAFAYIALEQIFEIATANLIRPITKNNCVEFYFTEDTEDRCKFYESHRPNGYLVSKVGEQYPAQWQRVAAIYYQLWNGSDPGFASKAREAIRLRNCYIHPKGNKKPLISSDEYMALFALMIEFLSLFK